jgi:acetyl esterase/lipase
MNMKKILVIFILLFTTVVACNKSLDDNPVPAPNPATALELKDVAYGADAAQKMDVYLPAGRSMDSTNVIVLIHGGAWASGDKADFNDIVASLKIQLPKYAIINMNYRLAALPSTNLWPTQLNDINTAFTFFASKASEYKINTNKVAICGGSAGGHLALLKAYKHNAGNIKAVVDLYGPTEMADLYNFNTSFQPLLSIFMAGTPTSNASNYANASPLYSVNSSAPPTIIFHGGLDATVPIRQSDSLNLRLANAGVAKQYITYPTEGHGWGGANLTDTYNKVAAFISLYVK